jgi:hypothetical protein
MAYNFNGTNQRLSTASTPVSVAPLTLYARNLSTGLGSSRVIIVISDASNVQQWSLRFAGNSYPRAWQYEVTDSGGTTAVFGIGSVAQTTWYSAGFVEAASNSRYVFFEASKSSTNTVSRTPNATAGIAIAGALNGTQFAHHEGQIADAAIWDVALTDDEAISLARGFKPFRIRPQSLKFYAPLVRTLQDLRGALTITNNNTATVADHPRVY